MVAQKSERSIFARGLMFDHFLGDVAIASITKVEPHKVPVEEITFYNTHLLQEVSVDAVTVVVQESSVQAVVVAFDQSFKHAKREVADIITPVVFQETSVEAVPAISICVADEQPL